MTPHRSLPEGHAALIHQGGEPVLCLKVYEAPCGMNLSSCSSGVNYNCVHDVVIVTKEMLDDAKEKAEEESEPITL